MTDWGAAPGTKKGSSGGGSPGAASSWGGGGAVKTGTSASPKVRDPADELTSSLTRLAGTLPGLAGGDADRVKNAILQKSQGLGPKRMQRLLSAVEGAKGHPGTAFNQIVDLENEVIARANKHEKNTALDYLNPVIAGGSILGKALETVSRPANAVMSTVAEATREGGWQHADIGKLLTAAKEGAQLKRHDSISGIVKENTGYKLKGVGAFAADLGGGIALDPLTYLSFGMSDAAKVGVKASSEILGAERTAEVMQKGAKILSAEENARLAKGMTDHVFQAFSKGVRGGVKVSRPTIGERTIAGRAVPTIRMSEGRTIIPGPFAQAKAGRIIAGTAGHVTPEVATETARVASLADEAARRAQELHGQASLSELAGGGAEHVAQLEGEATKFDDLARQIGDKVEATKAEQVRSAVTAGRSLGHNPITDTLARIGDTKIAEAVRGVFVPRGNVARRFGEATARGLDDARILYRGEFNSSVEDHVNQLLHAAKETGVTNDELKTIIGPALDIGGDAASVPEHLRPMYDALAEVRDRFTQAQITAGVAHEKALHITDEYFPRYLTDEAKKIVGKEQGSGLIPAVPGEASISRAPSGQLRARTANIDEPINQINPAFEAEHGVPKFEDNPLTAISRRAVEAEQDVATTHYVNRVLDIRDDAGKRFMFTAEEAKGQKLPPGYVEVKVPGGRMNPETGEYEKIATIHVPKEMESEVKKSYELLVNDQALKGFIGGLDKWMTLWKGYATVPLPFGLGFHERNAMGNVFLNWLGGIRPGDSAYGQAFKIQRAMSKGAKEGDVLKFLSGEDRRIAQAAREHDIIGEGFYGFDLPKNEKVAVQVPFRKATGSEPVHVPLTDKSIDVPIKVKRAAKAANPLNPSNALISSGRKLGSAIEENARLAHFIAKEKELGSAVDAARSVRKYLFDYSDLTATERHVFKRFMAFYTFTRKNLPVQIGAMLKTPGKFSHLEMAREAVARQADTPKGLYPSYLGELGGTPLPRGISDALASIPGLGMKKGQQQVFAPDLPLINATSSISPAVQLLTSLPGVDKIPGLPHNPEGAPGAFRDLATQTVSGGAPGAAMAGLQAFGAEKDFFSGRPLQGRVEAPAYARVIPGLTDDRVINGKHSPTLTTKSQYLAESLVPLLSKIGSAFPQGAYEQEKAGRRRLSTFAGLRVYPLGPGTSRGEALRRNQILQSLMADLRAKGIDISSSRSKSKKKKAGGW